MILIKKQYQPEKFREYVNSDKAHFDDMPTEIKSLLRKALLQEQGYLCAYCMTKISDAQNVKIEHFVPRNTKNELDYSNLLAVCKGGEGRPYSRQTCDSHKKDILINVNPQNASDIETISYTRNGYIKSSIPAYQRDLDKTLNLNDERGYLIDNRSEALKSFQRQLYHKLGKTNASREFLIKCLRQCSSLDKNGEYIPYVGIIIYYLQRRIG